jgi:hypothetical protein
MQGEVKDLIGNGVPVDERLISRVPNEAKRNELAVRSRFVAMYKEVTNIRRTPRIWHEYSSSVTEL